MSKDDAFKNVKEQVGYCGIWCGSCVVGNGALRELTKKYKELTEAYGLEKWAPDDFDYLEFSNGLYSIQTMPLCPGCLKGGGRDDCEMRDCAQSKQLHHCSDSECFTQEKCPHLEQLNVMRSGALGAGLFVKSQPTDPKQLVEEWAAKLKNKWPSCILFMDDE